MVCLQKGCALALEYSGFGGNAQLPSTSSKGAEVVSGKMFNTLPTGNDVLNFFVATLGCACARNRQLADCEESRYFYRA
jgi:hypothetical protein